MYKHILPLSDAELEDDPVRKLDEDSQDKDYLPEFQLDEELGDGDMDEDILLEGQEEGENDANDDEDVEEGDDVDIEEIEDKVDDRDIKELDEAVEGTKLQEDNGDNALQGPANDDNDKQDEVGLTVH